MDKLLILAGIAAAPITVALAVWRMLRRSELQYAAKVKESEPIGYALTDTRKPAKPAVALSESLVPTDEDWDTFEAIDKSKWAAASKK